MSEKKLAKKVIDSNGDGMPEAELEVTKTKNGKIKITATLNLKEILESVGVGAVAGMLIQRFFELIP